MTAGTIAWPFADSPALATLTTVNVLERRLPILLVSHDEDDAGWQMLCGLTNEDANARVVSLRQMYERDPSIGELSDLPVGWYAWRDSVESAWQRAAKDDEFEKPLEQPRFNDTIKAILFLAAHLVASYVSAVTCAAIIPKLTPINLSYYGPPLILFAPLIMPLVVLILFPIALVWHPLDLPQMCLIFAACSYLGPMIVMSMWVNSKQKRPERRGFPLLLSPSPRPVIVSS